MSSIQQWAGSTDTEPYTKVNGSLLAIAGAFCFAQREQAHSGLVVGIGGGPFNSATIADTTVTCTDSTTNYIVALRSSGVVSTSTSTTNWTNPLYGRVGRAVFAATVLTYSDERFGPSGIFDNSAIVTDAELAAIAGLTSAANKLPYFTGSGTAALADLSAFARTILDDADAATVRATIGAGTGGGDASTNTATSVDGEVVLFSSTTGKLLKRGTTTGLLKGASGVISAATAGTDYYAPGSTDVAVADGGTGSSTAGGARTNLGLVIGTDVQAQDADLATISGLTATTDNFLQAKSSAWASRTVAQVSADLQATGLITDAVGFRTIPQNSQSAAYTLVAADSGKHLLHPSADTTARTFTIDSNANVAYPVGTAITFVNQNSAGVMTIAITSDTMRLAGAGTTGSRSLAANGIATALKVAATEWIISGTNLT